MINIVFFPDGTCLDLKFYRANTMVYFPDDAWIPYYVYLRNIKRNINLGLGNPYSKKAILKHSKYILCKLEHLGWRNEGYSDLYGNGHHIYQLYQYWYDKSNLEMPIIEFDYNVCVIVSIAGKIPKKSRKIVWDYYDKHYFD